PAVSEMATRVFSISTGLEASMVTPGSTAPEVSETRPAMPPPSVCAGAAAGISNEVQTIIHTTGLAALALFICAPFGRHPRNRGGGFYVNDAARIFRKLSPRRCRNVSERAA